MVVGSLAIALSLFCHDGRAGHGDPRASRRGALAWLRAAHGSARRPRPDRSLAHWALPRVSNGGSLLSGRHRRYVECVVACRVFLGRDWFGPAASAGSAGNAGGAPEPGRTRHGIQPGPRGSITLYRLNVAVIGLRVRHW